jgi:hypothetical protein
MNRIEQGFESVEALGGLLQAYSIPIELWGQGRAKTVGHLFKELAEGDTELVTLGRELLRQVAFVNIDVYAEFDGALHRSREDRQVFDEGLPTERTRTREMVGAVKEKLHKAEKPDKVIERAVQEELQVRGRVAYKKLREEDLDEESPSYPGLRSKYKAHYFRADLKGDQIDREGYKEVQTDKTTYFVWDRV